MTLKKRILLFNLISILSALVCIGGMSYFEFHEQQQWVLKNTDLLMDDRPSTEAWEIVVGGGIIALLVSWTLSRALLRHALRPIEELTKALEDTNIDNLAEPVSCPSYGDEIERLAIVFNRLKKRLDLSFKQTREFSLHASHELKTPLTIMHGMIEQMLMHSPSPDERELKLVSLLEEVQRLSSISSQLAFLSKADAAQLSMNMTSVPMHELVQEAVEAAQELGRQKEIHVTLAECEQVVLCVDQLRCRQVLLNLMDNAVKYNHRGGQIIAALRVRDNEVEIVMENSGRTVDEIAHQRIFERFFRGDNGDDDIEGSGLGLSICATIMACHQGTIQYEVNEKGYNQIRLQFPRCSQGLDSVQRDEWQNHGKS
jgi:signal transduction histidine kinase